MHAHFAALHVNLFILRKRFQESFKMSVNLEDLDVDFVLQHFILCLFVNEDDDETNCNLIKEEDSCQCLKVLLQ